ncbi:MAG: hypothetical protein LBU57_02770 [Dysgonamonadaceae bacterium]|jgi:hypothetical protein|nr:hypothetical protein [Dysgonamonadaceae bacterium]
MKKGLLFIVVVVLFSLQPVVYAYAQQDAKQKVVVDTDSTAVDISLMDSNRLKVKNAPIGKKLEVYSIVGNKVKEFEIKSSYGEYLLNLPRSVYIIKLDGIVRKYVIK